VAIMRDAEVDRLLLTLMVATHTNTRNSQTLPHYVGFAFSSHVAETEPHCTAIKFSSANHGSTNSMQLVLA